jgi:hypothetical protein
MLSRATYSGKRLLRRPVEDSGVAVKVEIEVMVEVVFEVVFEVVVEVMPSHPQKQPHPLHYCPKGKSPI